MEEINGGSSSSSSSRKSSNYDDNDVDSEYRRQEEAERRAKRGESADSSQSSDNTYDRGDYARSDGKLDLKFFSDLDPITKNIIGMGLIVFLIGVFIMAYKVLRSYDRPKSEKKKKDKANTEETVSDSSNKPKERKKER